MSKITRDILNVLYDGFNHELNEIHTDVLIELAKEPKLGIDVKLRILAEMVDRLNKEKLNAIRD